MGFDSIFVYVFSKFSDSYDFAFYVLLQTFLSNVLSETLDSSMTVDFLVSVPISNLLFIVGLFTCFCGWGVLLGSIQVFSSCFLGFVYLSRVSFPPLLYGPKDDPSFSPFYYYYYLFVCL